MVKFEERKVYSGYPADVKKEQGMEKAIIIEGIGEEEIWIRN